MRQCNVYKRNVDAVQAALQIQDMTVAELAPHAGLSVVWMKHLAKQLRDDGLIHVWDWAMDKRGRFIIPIYRWGKGRSEPRTKKEPYFHKRKHKPEQSCTH